MDFQESMDELLKAADCPKGDDDDDKGGADASGGDTGDKDNGDGQPTKDNGNGAEGDDQNGDDQQGPPGAQVDGDDDQQMPPEEAGGGNDLAGLVDQIADAEQRFYAAKGQHGSGHHEVEVAMEDLHKLVRKLARRVAADSGMGQDDQQMQDGDDQQQQGPPNGQDVNGNGDDQGPPQKKKGPPEKLQQSLGPVAGELLRKSWPDPQLGGVDTMMGKKSRSKLNINVKPSGGKGQPDVQVDSMRAKDATAIEYGSGTSKPDTGKMSGEVSPENFVGDPNGGAFIDWGSQGYAEAHTDGTPSELFGQMTGKGKPAGQGQVPQPPFNAKMDTGYQPGVTGQSPYEGSDAGEAHPHYPNEAKYPSGDVPTPSAKMQGASADGSWIDWGGVAESGRSMPFAGEIAKMTAQQPAPAAPQAPAPPPAAPQGADMSGKMLLRDSIPKMKRAAPPQSSRGPSVPRKPAGKMSRKPANPKQPQRPPARPAGPKRPPAQPQGQMRGKMHSPVPSTPGQPISATAPSGPVGRMSESGYQSQMSGFDYAMLGRMQRLDAGMNAVEAPESPFERSDTEEPTLRKAEPSFDFLLELSEDFEKADQEMRSLLEDE